MSYYYFYPLSRCRLALSILFSVAAVREGDNALSLLQVGAKARPISLPTSLSHDARPVSKPTSLSHDHSAILTEMQNSAVLHIPYSRIAINLTYNNLGEEIITFPQRRPREFNVILATCKTWTADAIVQFGERRRGATWIFDWNRSIAFAIFGLIYIGFAQWFLYVSVLTWLFPDAMMFANAPLSMKLKDQTGMIDMAGQVVVDNLIFEVLIYFPVFYMIKATVQGTGSFASRMKTGLSSYQGNMLADNLASCAVWIPADVVIFACPMYLRMPMEHCVSFGWTMFISAMRGSDKEKSDAKAEP